MPVLVLVLLLSQLLLLHVVQLFLVGRVVVRVLGGRLVMAHNLIRLIWLLSTHVARHVSVERAIVSVAWLLHRINCPTPILARNLMVLHLLNNLLHVLARALQLGELLLEADVKGLQRDDFLWRGHALDTSEQVVGHVVGNLKNPILLQVDLSHARVLNLID